jgi:thiol-disulfide isomerase/thioredoxin
LVVVPDRFNEITDYLFKLLEKRSLFGSSEYLALKVLNELSCTVNNDLAAQLESYRAMKKGNTAPDIIFDMDVFAPGYTTDRSPQKLSDLTSKYTLVVFGASWCDACTQELTHIVGLYPKWKNQGVEVVFVSLDENPIAFKDFSATFPYISLCDYQKWQSPVVKAYHVFATPTLFLLDNEQKILLKPNSVHQMDAWLDYLNI